VLLRLAILLTLLLAPSPASAHPTVASDGIYIGARLEPGAALALAWDLDIYLTGDRLLSLGPAVSFAFLGEDGRELGRQQDYLFSVDVLRFKLSLNGGDDWARPYLFLGGGFYYAFLPEQRSDPHDVFLLPDGTPATAELRYERIEDLAGLASAGGGVDLYVLDSFAIAASVVTHLRIGDQNRIPLFWAEALVGIRFGL
jgi:hypothetical protein